ncbi:MAG: 30S ribosome-binding factor RbfA [Hydrogenibacillus schlegelii]|uniref:Ribosome-binding factor A n=1 Tax=Hydrogenibacillus schlegelii TaxID=1484 RepID=A0A2T5GD49_HYDSH|nr:30S ribosome-binding factor RbfA [Hydrogenibacillus schlegelii]PTQ54117.1 MAG: Ribosome-binding factor A [Hydrogenibacillus schlegelii]
MRRIRQERIAEQIKKELGRLIQTELKDPRVGFVTVTDVEVTPDLLEARVFVSVLGDDSTREAALEALRRAHGFLRSELARRIEVRHVPELDFRYDSSLDYGMRIDRILRDLRQADPGSGRDAATGPEAAGERTDAGAGAAERFPDGREGAGGEASP